MTEESESRWYRRLSLRTQLQVVSSVVVAVALAVGGLALLALIRADLAQLSVLGSQAG